MYFHVSCQLVLLSNLYRAFLFNAKTKEKQVLIWEKL